tara:strand:+ start:56 stop:775 length:720 start_codon:yes stop_codon:yes gene_type:complete
MVGKMKKILVLLSALLSLGVFAEGEGKHEMHAFYFLNVTNPAVVVGAMDKFAASDCGKQLPADVGLMNERINGSAASTHFIIVSYEKMADFRKADALMQSCPEGATMLQEIGSGSDPVTQFAVIPAIEVGDWGKDSVFMKYDMSVSDEAAYGAAWTELMDANVADGTVTSSYGLNRIFLGNNDASHFVYIGATDFETLTANQATLTSSRAFTKFSRKVGKLRKVLNTSLIVPVKAWPKQ